MEQAAIKVEKIIDRTIVQNRLLNKILDEIKEKETILDEVNEPNLKGKKLNNKNQ